MYYVYILRSEKDGKLYIGSTSDLTMRLRYHNAGNAHATKDRRPLKLLASEQFETRKEAMHREKYLKKLKNPVYALQIFGSVAQW